MCALCLMLTQPCVPCALRNALAHAPHLVCLVPLDNALLQPDDDASGAAAATDGSGVRGVPDAAFEQASLGMGGRPPAAPPSPLAGSHPDALIANACNELMDWLGGCVHGTGAHTHTHSGVLAWLCTWLQFEKH